MSRNPRNDDRIIGVPDNGRSRDLRSVEAVARGSREDFASRGLDLPRTEDRQSVEVGSRLVTLNERESRLLATVGAFRLIPTDDIPDLDRHSRHDALRHLKAQGLLSEQSFTDRAGVRHVLSLTEDGKALLDSRSDSTSGKAQTFHQGIVKPREVSHDSRLYRVFLEEAARLEREGSRVGRVELDYELKRDYQRYLNRPDRGADATPDADRFTFAEANDLHVVDGQIVFPDLRIEYETADGRTEHRDVELVTEHYSRSQLAAKAAAGFVQYRTGAAAGRSARTSASRSGAPFDPRHIERLL